MATLNLILHRMGVSTFRQTLVVIVRAREKNQETMRRCIKCLEAPSRFPKRPFTLLAGIGKPSHGSKP